MEQEIWKDIKGYEGCYQISSKGSVKSLKRISSSGRSIPECIRTPQVLKCGYLFVRLYKGNVGKNLRIHRLIAEAFIPNPDNKPCIDHINTIKTDNRIENLRWATIQENVSNPISRRKQIATVTATFADPALRKRISEKLKAKHKDKEFSNRIFELTHTPEANNKRRYNSKVKAVVHCDENGVELGRYRSTREAERELGLSAGSVVGWCKGRSKPKNKHKWYYL